MEELRAYFVAMRSEVSSMIMQGASEEDVLANFQTPEAFSHYAQADRLGRFLPYYYRPLKAEIDAR